MAYKFPICAHLNPLWALPPSQALAQGMHLLAARLVHDAVVAQPLVHAYPLPERAPLPVGAQAMESLHLLVVQGAQKSPAALWWTEWEVSEGVA